MSAPVTEPAVTEPALFTLEELAAAAMTPAEAKARYSRVRMTEWNSQPLCRCGHYAATHEDAPPHRGTLPDVRGRTRRQCDGYQYERMGDGGPPGWPGN